jgi:hypothetical protein
MMAGNDELLERDVQAFLLELLFGKWSSQQVARVVRLVCHRAASPAESLGDTSNSGSLSLLVRIVQQARMIPDFDISPLQVLIFKQSPFIRSMFFATTEPLTGALWCNRLLGYSYLLIYGVKFFPISCG